MDAYHTVNVKVGDRDSHSRLMKEDQTQDFVTWKEACQSLFMKMDCLKEKRIVFDPGKDWLYKAFQERKTSHEVVDMYITWYCY